MELLLVLESEAGSRERVTLQPPRPVSGGGDAEAMATLHVARWLVRHGYSLAPRLRVRRDRGGALADAPELREALRRAVRNLEEEGEEGDWE